MPDPKLSQLAPAEETKAFRAVVDVLQSDAVLSRLVRGWDVFDGDTGSVLPPPRARMPWVRVLPGPSAMEIAEERAYMLDFTLYVSVATEGLHADDHLNFWAALRRALMADRAFRATTVQRYLRTLGVTVHKVSNPGFAPLAQPIPDRAAPAIDLFGTARIVLKMIIPF